MADQPVGELWHHVVVTASHRRSGSAKRPTVWMRPSRNRRPLENALGLFATARVAPCANGYRVIMSMTKR